MNISETVDNFRDFLNKAYPYWFASAEKSLHENGDFLDENYCDWAQANWELLVERVLCKTDQFLEIYGSGSDYELGRYSRVFFRDALPTHRIYCKSENKIEDKLTNKTVEIDQLLFNRFVSFKNEKFDDSPSFDHLLLEEYSENTFVVISADNITFSMEPLHAT